MRYSLAASGACEVNFRVGIEMAQSIEKLESGTVITCSDCGKIATYQITENGKVTYCCDDCMPTCDCCSELLVDCSCSVCPGCNHKTESLCENCEQGDCCCECSYCENCGKATENICSHCNCCERHCDCITCEHCGEVCNDNCCGDCGRCCDCCDCEDSDCHPGPRRVQEFRIEKPTNLKGFQRNRLTRPISVELELASIPEQTALLAWAKKTGAGLVADGSIPDSGCEINSNPAVGDLFVDRMQSLANALKDSQASVNSDCGLHVHIDASNYTQFDLRRVMLLWIGIEPAMFKLVSRSRHENTYCQPCANEFIGILSDQKSRWQHALASGLYNSISSSVPKQKHNKYEDCRYMALNLHSYNLRKTLEFRLHEARIEDYILVCWPIVCGHIVDFAYRSAERDLLRMIRSRRTSLEILLAILPADLQEWVLTRMRERQDARANANTFQQTRDTLQKMEQARQTLIVRSLWYPAKKVNPRKIAWREKQTNLTIAAIAAGSIISQIEELEQCAE